MKTKHIISALIAIAAAVGLAFVFLGESGATRVSPANGEIRLPLSKISDGKAHFYKVKADNGGIVTFFALKSSDGVYRAAVDACDVCYQSGKGYYQEGDNMVCRNCGQKFASTKINVIRGGCNPAPLGRRIVGDELVVTMSEINANSWYFQFTA